jgi:enamine deaminase RidA (YjgF/YER057c/UK114 family)
MEPINPPALARPRGYSHAMKGSGEVLFVAGQIGWDSEARLVSADFVAQFAQALSNILTIVAAAGGGPLNIGRMTLYVVDKRQYATRAKEVGLAYRERMGLHFPAMTLVEVKSLLEEGALVEIEATAVL